MAKRHGITIEEGKIQFKMGIWQIFDPWTYGPLLGEQGYQRHPERRPLYIEYHFRRVANRLFRSLNRLYSQCREYDKFIEDGSISGQNPELCFEIPEEIGIAADSVVHYLNLFAEDLARIIPFVLSEDVPEYDQKDIRGTFFGKLTGDISPDEIYATQEVKKLFSDLKDNNNSWWSLALKPKYGVRQRLVHYTDLITCTASTKPGDSEMTPDFTLHRVGSSEESKPLEETLKALLTDLCSWLDDLEKLLLPILVQRLAQNDVQWSPFDELIHTIPLPIPCADRFDVSSFYMPECG